MKQKLLALVMTLAVLVTCISVVVPTGAVATYSGGDGTEINPYIIAGKEDLIAFAEAVDGDNRYANTYFKLTADIDLGNTEWNPIGGRDPAGAGFHGVFDGDGHTVSGMKISGSASTAGHAGLFGSLYGATVKNLTVKGEITGTSGTSAALIGGLCGVAENSTVIDNVHVYVDINVSGATVAGNVGGIVSRGNTASIKNSSYTGTIVYTTTAKNQTEMGGLAGACESGSLSIENCRVNVNATLSQVNSTTLRLGGVVGKSQTLSVTDTVVYGNLKGSTSAGAIARIGGVVGNNYGPVTATACAFIGNIERLEAGTLNEGGIIGNTDNQNNVLTNCVTNHSKVYYGAASSENCVGGIKLTMQAGAAVRVLTPTGIRFSTEIGKTTYSNLEKAFTADGITIGTLISPAEYVAACGDTFTHAALDSLKAAQSLSEAYKDVRYEADEWFYEGDTAYVFTGAIADILEENYTLKYSGIGYMTIKLSENTSVTFYAEYDADNARTIQEVAYGAYYDRAADDTDGVHLNAIPETSEHFVPGSGAYSPYTESTLAKLKPLFLGYTPSN